MAKCKWCGKSSIFLSINKDGLCKPCSHVIISETQSKLRVINDSGDITLNSKNVDTISSRSEVAINLLEGLIKYEDKGIPILTRPVRNLIIEFGNTANERITDLS